MSKTTNDCVEESSGVPPGNSKQTDLTKGKTPAQRKKKNFKNPLFTSITARQLKALLNSYDEREKTSPGPSGVRVKLEAPPREKPKRMVMRRAKKPSTGKRGRPRKKQFDDTSAAITEASSMEQYHFASINGHLSTIMDSGFVGYEQVPIFKDVPVNISGAWDADTEKPGTSKLRFDSVNSKSSAVSVSVASKSIDYEQVSIFSHVPIDTSSGEAAGVERGPTYTTYCESLVQKMEDLPARNSALEMVEKHDNVEDVGTTAFTIAERRQLHRKPYDWLSDCDIDALVGSFAPYCT